MYIILYIMISAAPPLHSRLRAWNGFPCVQKACTPAASTTSSRLPPSSMLAILARALVRWPIGRPPSSTTIRCCLADTYEDAIERFADLLEESDNDLSKAEAVLLCRRDSNPEDSEVHLDLGLLWRETGKAEKSLGAFRRAIQLDEDYTTAHQMLGEVLADDKEMLSEAEASLLKAVSLDETRHEGFGALGRLFYRTGRLDEAATALGTACELEPAEPTHRADLADALRATGRFQAARLEYERAAELGWECDQSLRYLMGSQLNGEEGVHAAVSTPVVEVPAAGLFVPDAWKQQLSTVYTTPVASLEECAWIVSEAEKHAAAAGGWDGHHTNFRTQNVVVAESDSLLEWLNGRLRDVIWPALAEQFDVELHELWLLDAFIVRYDPAVQAGLASHWDDSELSFNIALSDPAGFEGGGTRFSAAGVTVRPQQGEMISHYGRVFHAGAPVQSGVRYILAGFVRVETMAAAWRDLRPARIKWASPPARPTGSGQSPQAVEAES